MSAKADEDRIIKLWNNGELTFTEVAERLGISSRTVARAVSKWKKKFRQ